MTVIIEGDREVIAWFDKVGDVLHTELKASISRLSISLQNEVKANKLSGQVLGVRSGHGRRSIQQVVEDQGNVISGVVSTAVPYMIGWETGWPDLTDVKSSKAKFDPKGGTANSDTFKNGSAKKRPFLVPALKEMQASGKIQAEMDMAIQRATK